MPRASYWPTKILLAFLESAELAPCTLVGRARESSRGSVNPFQASDFDLGRRWWRGQILVEPARVSLCHGGVRHVTNQDELFPAKRARDLQLVTDVNRAMRFGGVPVQVHLATLARALRFRASFEQAGDVEPDVDSNRIGPHVV